MSINKWTFKKVVYLFNGTLLSTDKEWIVDKHTMDEYQNNYTE